MATNTLLTPDMITLEALRVLKNQLNFTKKVNRQYSSQFARGGAKIGNSLNIRKPVRYVGRTGQAMSVENSTETQTTLTLDTQFGVDIEFSSQELTLDINNFSRQFLVPAIAAIANKIDRDGLLLYRDVYNTVGTVGTIPTALSTYLDAGVKLDDEATPMDGQRCVVVDPQMQADIVNALTGLFHSSEQIKSQYEKGKMGTAAGFDWFMDQNVVRHTVGTWETGSTGVVNGANQTGSSLVTDGWAASTAILFRGDVIRIGDDVNAVNPQNRQSTGQLRDFVVTEDVTSDGSGNATIPVSPDITPSGQFQTVTATPDDGDALVVFAASSEAASGPQGLAFHPDAFTFASADLVLPDGVDFASRKADPDLGISIRCVRQYEARTDLFPCRLDVLYGWKTVRPELACRITG